MTKYRDCRNLCDILSKANTKLIDLSLPKEALYYLWETMHSRILRGRSCIQGGVFYPLKHDMLCMMSFIVIALLQFLEYGVCAIGVVVVNLGKGSASR